MQRESANHQFPFFMLILLDPAHGHNTPGKRSPDGTLLEYAYTRDLARQIVTTLKARGYDSELLVPEDDDIPLSERVRRTNAHCQALGKSNVILISIHVNAAGDGTRWHTATGWSCYTTKGHTLSDTLATASTNPPATPTVPPSSSKTSSWTIKRISPTSSHKKADEK